jgi:folate-binding protein YgfZ
VSDEHEAAVMDGAAVTVSPKSVVSITGAGAVACLQGVLTNDVEHAGERGVVFGALLTPKGMIVTDLWSARTDDELLAILPANGREAALEIFQRYFPPRLAKTHDRSPDTAVLELYGPEAVTVMDQAGITLPAPGSTARVTIAGSSSHLLRPHEPAPVAAMIVCPRSESDGVLGMLQEAGVVAVPPAAGHLARILSGWPELGAEIGAKTLPQEVRFDDLEGVSYTKGCYTGQETVARVHFRGHPNRRLVGLVWRDAPDPADSSVISDTKAVGAVTSAAWSGAWDLWIGIAMVRRELEIGSAAVAAGSEARVVSLPIPKP